MGSALCFPVQCIVFSAIALYAAMLYWRGECPTSSLKADDPILCVPRWFMEHLVVDPEKIDQDHLAMPRVFGDDIIVDSRLAPYLTHLLTTFGFSVNLSKSFTGSQAFRESCGGFYWGGYDVTPLRFRVKGAGAPLGASAVASLVSLANASGDAGFTHLRRLAIRYVLFERKECQAPVPFTSDKDAWGVFSKTPRNTHIRRRRINADYQRDEWWVATVIPAWREAPRADEIQHVDAYLYRQWWGSRRDNATGLEFSEPLSRLAMGGAQLRGTWVPSGT
jgi:hypothetical protein